MNPSLSIKKKRKETSRKEVLELVRFQRGLWPYRVNGFGDPQLKRMLNEGDQSIHGMHVNGRGPRVIL